MKKKISTFILLISEVLSLAAQEWHFDLKEAETIAQQNNRRIILVFQGSDWCAPCIKLNLEIWSSDEFKNYAKDHFVMLLADFPRKKKNQLSKEQQGKNNKLFEKYNKQGYFPCVVVLDKNGNVLGTTGYKKVSPKEYIKILESFEK